MDEVDLVELTSEVVIDDADEIEGDEASSLLREHYESGTMSDEEIDAIADTAVVFLREIFALFGETGIVIDEYEGDDGELILDASGGDLAVLIGRHGRTLDSLQLLLSSYIANTIHFHYPIVVDIEGYKSRRRAKLASLARHAAARAKRQRGTVRMAPMNSYERRIVHLALVDDVEVATHSEGDDPNRFVVITYVRD